MCNKSYLLTSMITFNVINDNNVAKEVNIIMLGS